jgi:tyrosine-protein phosphatase SIW14
MFRLLFCLLLVPGLLNAEPQLSTKDIPRFQVVTDGFYRGGQPERAGFEFLKKQGVRTVINFREENGEEALVRSLGMNYIQIPMSLSIFSSTIPENAIAKYFEVLRDQSNFPIFVHCRRGADRTGAMVGFFRMAFQGWSAKKAYDEARDIGLRWWYTGIKKQLENFKLTTD